MRRDQGTGKEVPTTYCRLKAKETMTSSKPVYLNDQISRHNQTYRFATLIRQQCKHQVQHSCTKSAQHCTGLHQSHSGHFGCRLQHIGQSKVIRGGKLHSQPLDGNLLKRFGNIIEVYKGFMKHGYTCPMVRELWNQMINSGMSILVLGFSHSSIIDNNIKQKIILHKCKTQITL